MGQAFRRASGRIRATDSSPKTVAELKPLVEISRKTTVYNNNQNALDSDYIPRVNPDNILEERDPQYEAILSQMVGRIKSKPGGKLEIAEPAVVERYNRPMPKLRNTKPESSRYEERSAPTGTVNVAQLCHIMLLYQGKADDHNGAVDIHRIAEKFRLDVPQVQKFL